jgi:hypothetical protein
MKHPFDSLPASLRNPIFWTFLIPTVILAAVMQVVGAPLKTDAAPAGIVSFELAGTSDKASQILVSWEPVNSSAIPVTKLYAAFGLGLDYLFMPTYAIALGLATLLAAGKYSGWVKSIGAAAGWGALFAALFDATENFVLWKSLIGAVGSPYPQIAFYCASIKFTLIILGLIYALVGGLWPARKIAD